MSKTTKRKGVQRNIKTKVLNRDNHCCQKCGCSHFLEIHHIKWREDTIKFIGQEFVNRNFNENFENTFCFKNKYHFVENSIWDLIK